MFRSTRRTLDALVAEDGERWTFFDGRPAVIIGCTHGNTTRGTLGLTEVGFTFVSKRGRVELPLSRATGVGYHAVGPFNFVTVSTVGQDLVFACGPGVGDYVAAFVSKANARLAERAAAV